MRLPLTLAISLVLAGSLVAQPPAGAPEPDSARRAAAPSVWLDGDIDRVTARYALEAARFPSGVLAQGLATTLRNLGWAPVEVVEDSAGASVLVGNFAGYGSAHYLALEFDTQRITAGRVVPLPSGAAATPIDVQGPFLPPFLPSPEKDVPFNWENAKIRLRGILKNLPEKEQPEFEQALTRLLGPGSDSLKAGDATFLCDHLHAQRTDPEIVLYLAGKVARGEWPGSDAERLKCAEMVADLYYGHRRDWRAAWASTEALRRDPARDAAGRARDLLRRGALMVEVAAGADPGRPSWGKVREELRRAHDETPVNRADILAQIELVYLQTFAWEGDWSRVEDLARAYVSRHPEQRSRTALARIFWARSLERKSDFGGALSHLDRVIAVADELASDPEGLGMGKQRLDIGALARKWRQHFVELQAKS